MTFEPEIGDGAQLADLMQSVTATRGYHLPDATECEVTVGSGLSVDVASGDAILGETVVTVDSQTGVTLPAADPDNPRKALVYIDGNGDVQTLGGDANSPYPSGWQRRKTALPAVPVPTGPFLPLSEIWIAAGATEISDGDIFDRRATVNTGFLRAHQNAFLLTPDSMSPDERQVAYNYFDPVVQSYQSTGLFEYLEGDTTVREEIVNSSSASESIAQGEDVLDVITTSDIWMDSVAVSEASMNAMSASSTARDAIWNSDMAFTTVADVNMAIGKYAVGYAGLDPSDYADVDAVSTSQTAMDSVSTSQMAMEAIIASPLAMDAMGTSQTAMDAITTSEVALSLALGSSFVRDSMWSRDMASTTLWEAGTPTPPHNFTSAITLDTFDGMSSPGKSLTIDANGPSTDGRYLWDLDVDLTNYNDLNVFTQIDRGGATESINLVVDVDGTELFSTNSSHTWTEQTVDVSGYSGTSTVQLGLNFAGNLSSQYIIDFADLHFV